MYKTILFFVLLNIINCFLIKKEIPIKNYDDIYKSLIGTWQMNHDKTIQSLIKDNIQENWNQTNLYHNLVSIFKNDVPEVMLKFHLNTIENHLLQWDITYSIWKKEKFIQTNKKGVATVLEIKKNQMSQDTIYLELIEKNEKEHPVHKEIIKVEFLNLEEIKISLQSHQNEKYFNEIYFKKTN